MKKFYIFLFAVIALTTVMMVITFDYCDTDSLTAWSVNIWDLLFTGKLSEFYSYAEQNLRGAFHANCVGNYLWIFPYALWNFPLWVVHSMTGELLVTDFWSLCWSKTFLVVLSMIAAGISYQICRMFTDDKEKLFIVYILILASPELLMSTGYAGQDEILYITFLLAALYYYLNGKDLKFYLWAICSVACCTIMLIPVLALLLIKEKNVMKLVIAVLGTQVPSLLFEVLYRNNKAYHMAKTDFSLMMENMFRGGTISVIFGEASVLAIGIIVLYFYCYCMDLEGLSLKEGNRKVIYILTSLFLAMSLLMNDNFYRLFLYIPFLSILIVISDAGINTNLLFMNVLTYGRALMALKVNGAQNMNTRFVMKDSWISGLCDVLGENRNLQDIGLYDKLMFRFPTLDKMVILIISCIIAGTILLLWINIPSNVRKYDMKISKKALLAGYVMCMPLFLGMFFKVLLF